jgi:Peptidase family M23
MCAKLDRSAASVVWCLVLALCGTSAQAQHLYKYRDQSGAWVYTDRQPEGDRQYEESDLSPSLEPPGVSVLERPFEGGVTLVANNRYYCPVELAFQLSRVENLAADAPRFGDRVLAPRGETELAVLKRARGEREMSFLYDFQYILGDPTTQHAPREPYRLPFALAKSFRVSQAPPMQITHLDVASADAIDFVMPVGTPLYAARAGTVVEVASDFYDAGLDPSVDGPRANIVKVLHDDGTLALYAHLNWNSIRVLPGQHVARGEYLADSGNTGFSSGPHLHFVVQMNKHGAVVSVPVRFAGPGGTAVTLGTGDIATAY